MFSILFSLLTKTFVENWHLYVKVNFAQTPRLGVIHVKYGYVMPHNSLFKMYSTLVKIRKTKLHQNGFGSQNSIKFS
jgi:hypothetical protein